MSDSELAPLLKRVAEALERLSPNGADDAALDAADGFVWHADGARLEAVLQINRLELSLLKGIDRVRDILLDNTRRFARGLPANNALLWGARGMGKSSLIKAVHGVVAAEDSGGLKLIEIHREEIASLPILLGRLRECDSRCLLFCDDLSFEAEDTTYKSLKAALEGGISGRPGQCAVLCDLEPATSDAARHDRQRALDRDPPRRSGGRNRSHFRIDSVSGSASIPAIRRHSSPWLRATPTIFRLNIDREALRAEAIEWSMTRGARSGRVAWQFVQDLAGRLGVGLSASG